MHPHDPTQRHPHTPTKVMEALKILKGGVPINEACRYTYCLREPTRKGLFLLPTPLEKPAQSCFVCNTNTVRRQVRHVGQIRQITIYCRSATCYPTVVTCCAGSVQYRSSLGNTCYVTADDAHCAAPTLQHELLYMCTNQDYICPVWQI